MIALFAATFIPREPSSDGSREIQKGVSEVLVQVSTLSFIGPCSS
jgi:hypothetical protein